MQEIVVQQFCRVAATSKESVLVNFHAPLIVGAVRTLNAFLTLLTGMFVSGCSDSSIELQKIRTENEQLRNDVRELRHTSEWLDNRLKATATNFASVSMDLLTHEMEQPRWIVIDPTATGYQVVYTDLGHFLISTKEVVPYLDGYKVRLQIGNPYSFACKGVKISARWGKIDPAAEDKTGEFNQSETLYSGQWNDCEFKVAPASIEDIRGLRISLKPSTLQMRSTETR
jgi:hypothetical protein